MDLTVQTRISGLGLLFSLEGTLSEILWTFVKDCSGFYPLSPEDGSASGENSPAARG